jgi:DNA-binding PadR family transcriptional regulator
MSIKYAILGLLHYKDMHGYRIKDHIEKDFGHMWSVNFGQIYNSLRLLKKEGLIEITDPTPSSDGGPKRKCYTILPAGREAFARWLSEPPERPMLLRDPFLLKFAFSQFGDNERIIDMLDEQIAVYEKQLIQRKTNRKRWESQDVTVQLLADLGIRQNELYLSWLRHARDEIKFRKNEIKAAGSENDLPVWLKVQP